MGEPDPHRSAWSPRWEHLQEVLDAITDHVWIATPRADHVLYSNRAYETIYGEAVEALLEDPTSFLAVVAEEDRPAVVGPWHQPRPHETVLHVRRRDGEERLVRARNFPVRDETGKVVLVAGVSEDVTDQKRLAAAQREQLRMLKLSNVIVFGWDDNLIRHWNGGAERLYGYTADQAEGQPIRALLQTAYPIPQEEIRDHLAAHGHWTGTLQHRTRDGRTITVATHCVLHHDDDLGETLVIEANNDITDLVDAQRESAQLRSELNRSERLDALGQLAGGIAHDFNNLLAVILNDLSFALDHLPPGSPASVDVTNARRAAERATALTRQLLVFAQRDTSEPSPVDLDHLLGDLAPILERTAGDHIDLRVDLGGGGRSVHGDPTRLEQVLFNLVVNARDAMPYGGTLTIATSTDPTGEQLTLAVSDTGTGMTEVVRSQAFEPFYTTKPKGQGTGLGLSTVFGVATQCGGTASIESAPGEGTTVVVRFPTTAPPAEAVPNEDAPVRRILLIEDDRELRRSTGQVLEAAGHQVTTAADADEAARLLTDQPIPDLIVTDLMLPGRPVMDLLADLRRQHPDLPVIAITGFPPARRDLLPPPFTLIPKPFTREQLSGTITVMLADRHPGP